MGQKICLNSFGLWQPFCSAEQNHLCFFGKEHNEKHNCEIILMQTCAVAPEMIFKDISISVLGAIVQQSITICAI